MHGTVPVEGDIVWIRQQRWRVERVRRASRVIRLDVASRQGRLTFLAPFDRCFRTETPDRPRPARRQTCLARLAGVIAHLFGDRQLAAVVGAGIEILPYQLEPALAMLAGERRILLADAVGLGKTIQAGVAIAELARRAPALRVLVIAPASLRQQWLDELRDHFAMPARLADSGTLAGLARTALRTDRPWDRAGVVIASIDYLKQPQVLGAAARAPWDLIIADEAHGLSGDSQRHDAAEALARRARRLLLLTATPHSGDPTAYDRLISLGALPGEPQPLVFRRTRESIGVSIRRRPGIHRVRLSGDEARLLDALGEFEQAVRRSASVDRRADALLLASVFRKRALSTITAFNVSIARRLAWLNGSADGAAAAWQQGTLPFEEEPDDDVIPEERGALTADIGVAVPLERAWLRRLDALGRAAAGHESKLRYLVSLLAKTPEPVAIFTEFRDSLIRAWPAVAAIRSASVLHGGMPPVAQQEALARFRAGTSTVLLATDVASQGLNLQHRCRWVLCLDLPWNPTRLEQRTGRVDRIGQRRAVHTGWLIARHHSDDMMLARLHERQEAAEQGLDRDVTRSARWARPARRLARVLSRQRRFAGRWQGDLTTARPLARRLDSLPLLKRATGGRPVWCYLVPLLDRLGAVVERHLVAVTADLAAADGEDARDRLRRLAAARLEPRARRLARRRRTEADREISLERAVHDVFRRSHAVGASQPGLFDRRAIRLVERMAGDMAALDAAVDRRVQALEDSVPIAIGEPTLIAIFHGGRGA